MLNIWHNWSGKLNVRAANSSSCTPRATRQQAFLLFRQTCCCKNNTFFRCCSDLPKTFSASNLKEKGN